ncbi:MAG: hypothetical protein QW723_06105 [Candidatus Bathyarchaeia archaeon]
MKKVRMPTIVSKIASFKTLLKLLDPWKTKNKNSMLTISEVIIKFAKRNLKITLVHK